MGEKYTNSDFRNVAKQLKALSPCDETMQVYVKKAENGVAQGVWQVDRKFLNGHGVVMGGFVAGAVDIIMAYAISSILTDEEGFASIDLDTTFHKPTIEGEAEINATVKRRGRTISYITGEVKQNDKIVANCVSSVIVSRLS